MPQARDRPLDAAPGARSRSARPATCRRRAGARGGTFVADPQPPTERPRTSCWPVAARSATAAWRSRSASRCSPPSAPTPRRSTRSTALGDAMDGHARGLSRPTARADVRFHVGLAECHGQRAAGRRDDRGAGRDDRPDREHLPPGRGAAPAPTTSTAGCSPPCASATTPRAARVMTEHVEGTEHILAGLLPCRRATGLTVHGLTCARACTYLRAKDGPPHHFPGEGAMASTGALSADEQRLAELGYKQELKRGWSGFSNFAISFSIISVLAGCFTTYCQAWNNGGPIAISIALAGDQPADPARRLLDVRAGLGIPDGGRHLLLVLEAGRARLGLVHGLVQPDRPRRRRRLGRLRLRDVPQQPAAALQPALRLQLRHDGPRPTCSCTRSCSSR